MSRIQQSTFDFLKELSANNNRDWFADHKPHYEAARENVAEFADALLRRLSASDELETISGKKSMFRIYRDVRFSKNKQPYKTALSGSFRRASQLRRGGYYFHLSPGDTLIGGGFYGIEKDDLKRIRQEFDQDGDSMRKIMSDQAFVEQFGEMRGEQLKTSPQAYSRDHPNIDLLRYKQFYAGRQFTDREVLSANFLDEATAALLALRPFFDYFSEVLTTDANGELRV